MTTNEIKSKIDSLLSEGSARDKALFVSKEYTERLTFNKKEILTLEDVQRITDSLTEEEAESYNHWLHIYNVYLEINPLLGIVYKEYQTQAEKVLGYLEVWESYNQEENHLNIIYQDLLDSGNTKALETFSRSLTHLKFMDAKVKRDEDGYIEIDITDLYNELTGEIDFMKSTYETAKAMVMATEEFSRRTKSKQFMPELTKGAISDIKGDYVLNVAPKYSRKKLQERIDRGIQVTDDERKRAVYPYYEELSPSMEFVEMFRERIRRMEEYA